MKEVFQMLKDPRFHLVYGVTQRYSNGPEPRRVRLNREGYKLVEGVTKKALVYPRMRLAVHPSPLKGDAFSPIFGRITDVTERSLFVEAIEPRQNRFARPAAANIDQLVIIGQTELLACLYAVRRQNLTAHRRTGQNDLISAAEQLLCLFKANEYAVRVLCEHLRYLAGQRVDLEQHSRNAELLCRAYHRERRIAAAADHKIGFDLLHNGLCLGAREGQIPQRNDVALDVVQRQPALETGDLDMVEGIARLSYQTVLHALLAAGKVDLGRRVCLFDSTCNGKCRVDMAGSAAGSDQNSHDNSSSIISASGQAIGELPTGLRPQNSRYSSLRARRASSRLMVRSFSSASR